MLEATRPRGPMPGRALLAATLVLLLAVAGCLGTDSGDEAVTPGATDERQAGDADDPGASKAPPMDGEDEANDTRADARDPVTVAVDFDGETGFSACVPSGPNACVGPGLSQGADSESIDLQDAIARASLTLWWNSTTPTTDELALSLSRVTSCGQECYRFERLEGVTGTSPLVLAVNELGLAAGETVDVSVGVPSQTPPPLVAVVHPSQPFHVAGTLTGPPPGG